MIIAIVTTPETAHLINQDAVRAGVSLPIGGGAGEDHIELQECGKQGLSEVSVAILVGACNSGQFHTTIQIPAKADADPKAVTEQVIQFINDAIIELSEEATDDAGNYSLQ